MVLDASQVRFLVVLQREIGDAAHGRGFALRQLFVDLVDALRDVRVRLVEEIGTEGKLLALSKTSRLAETDRFFLMSLNLSRAVFESLRVFCASFSVSTSLASTSSSLPRIRTRSQRHTKERTGQPPSYWEPCAQSRRSSRRSPCRIDHLGRWTRPTNASEL
jgi:hypothetical protein